MIIYLSFINLSLILKEKEEMTESDRPEKILVTENAPNSEVISLVALSCGLISVGTSNKDVVLSILDIIKDKASKTDQPVLAGDSIYRILSLGLALPFMCQQETVDSTIAALNEIIPDGHCEQDFRDFTLVLLDALAYTATGNVLKIQKFLHICSENANEKKSTEPEEKKEESTKKDEKKSDKKDEKKDDKKKEETKAKVVFSKHSVAVLGIGLIAMNDDIGTDMSFRVLSSILRYGEQVIKKTVPLALAILCTSNPKLSVLDTLAKLSHDNDVEVAQNAILAQGIVASGTNNARLAQQLRQLAQYYAKDASSLFMVRLTQGFVHMGKGTMTLQAYQGDRTLLNNVSLAGLTTLMVACTDNNGIILGGKNAHYLLYSLMLSTQPKVLQTFDEDLKPLQVSVRVGLAVDTVGQAGRPKTITGFTTRTTPVLLNYGERAELATDEYLALTPVFEGFVILRKNPNFEKE